MRRQDAFLVCNVAAKTVELRYGGSKLEVLCYFQHGEQDELFDMLRYLLTSYAPVDNKKLLAVLEKIRSKTPTRIYINNVL